MPTLTITFNNANGFDLTQASFTETLPTGLTIETSPAPSTTCTGTSGSLTTSASKVTLTGADIPPKGSCSITLSVGGAAGTYASAIAVNALMTGPGGGNTAAVSASLTVNSTPPLPVPSKKSGGGELDWLDMMFVAGVLLVGRRQVGRQAARPQGRPPRR
jgi:hypothetical protein